MTYDAHPDDPEFERLLALLLSEARVPVGETDEQHDDRMGRYHEIERQLLALDQPVAGVDYDPPSTDIDADPLITPGDLLAPRSPWLRDVGSTRITREGFTQHEPRLVPDAEAVRRAAEQLKGTSSASKLLAGQLVAHHVLVGLTLPHEVLKALAVALGLQARYVATRARRAAVERAYAAGRSTADIAAEQNLKTRSVTRLRSREAPPSFDVEDACERALALVALPPRRHNETQDDERHMRGQDAKALWDIVADLTERDLVLPPQVFHATIVALGLTLDGRLRQQVIEDILPEREPEWRLRGLVRREPEYEGDDGLHFVSELREPEPRIGVRKRRDEYRRAVEFEAAARAKRFDAGDLTEQVLTAGQLARKLKRTDLTVIKNWPGDKQFQFDAYSLAFEMTAPRRAAMGKVVLAEARAIVRGEPQPSIESLAALVGVETRVVATWRSRGDWQQRLDSVVERAPAHWSRGPKADRTRSRDAK